jgi:hypothetical protein
MIKLCLRRGLQRFSRHYDYNTDYLEYLLRNDLRAFLKFGSVKWLSGHRRGVPVAPWCAASIRAAIAEDCGPCVQLVCNMALEAGVDPAIVRKLVNGSFEQLPAEVALAARFTEYTLAHDPAADELRADIEARWGPQGLVSLGFAISASRVYPTLKYALGYARTCSRIEIGQESVTPGKALEGRFA